MNLPIGLYSVAPGRLLALGLLAACALAVTTGSHATQKVSQGHKPDTDSPTLIDSAGSADNDGYTLYFRDEFEMTDSGAPNPSHWDFDVSYVRNNELQ